MKLVVDASVAVKWFFRESDEEGDMPAALDILQGWVDGRYSLLQPVHFQAEMCAVLAREAPAQMRDNLRDLRALTMPTRDDDIVLWRAMQLSSQLQHHLFDTIYHAVALETEDALLVTADDRYSHKAQALGRLTTLSAWPPG